MQFIFLVNYKDEIRQPLLKVEIDKILINLVAIIYF